MTAIHYRRFDQKKSMSADHSKQKQKMVTLTKKVID